MNIKKVFALLLSVVMLLSFAACAQTPADKEIPGTTEVPTTTAPAETTTVPAETTDTPEETTAVPEGKVSITVKVVHADGSEKVFTYNTDEEFLGDLLLADGLIKGNDGPYGLEITEVDGETAVYATDKAYWALYEGDQYALQGISTTPVVDGGEYGLVYTKG